MTFDATNASPGEVAPTTQPGTLRATDTARVGDSRRGSPAPDAVERPDPHLRPGRGAHPVHDGEGAPPGRSDALPTPPRVGPVDTCDLCGGEGYISGLIVWDPATGDDLVVDEICHQCSGTGTVPPQVIPPSPGAGLTPGIGAGDPSAVADR